jgi:Tfp pilus assembly protein PilV
MKLRRATNQGFTLAEVLAAMVFMAIVIPVAISGLGVASRAGEVAVRKTEASLLAERILNENVVTTNWNQSVQSGTLRQGHHDFRYTVRSENWNEDPNQDSMRLLSVEVIFTAKGSDYNVRLSTLVDSETPFLGTNIYQQ